MLKPLFDRFNRAIDEVRKALGDNCAREVAEIEDLIVVLLNQLVELKEVRNRLFTEVNELKSKRLNSAKKMEGRKLSTQDLDDLDEYLAEIGDEPMAYVYRESVIELSRLARLQLKTEDP